jgi:hypothetical protein
VAEIDLEGGGGDRRVGSVAGETACCALPERTQTNPAENPNRHGRTFHLFHLRANDHLLFFPFRKSTLEAKPA